MKDSELNQILRSAAVPRMKTAYWQRFAARVKARIEASTPRIPQTEPQPAPWLAALRPLLPKPAMAMVLAGAGLLLAVVLWHAFLPRSASDPQLSAARQYFREICALFPNQVQALVFDEQGPHLVLSAQPDVPASPPIYLSIHGPRGNQRLVTFSGQQIRINGDVCDVLVSRQGEVLVVGREFLWSSSHGKQGEPGSHRIEARLLNAS